MDKEQIELVVFEIVNSAGTAKGLAYEALSEALTRRSYTTLSSRLDERKKPRKQPPRFPTHQLHKRRIVARNTLVVV